MIDGAVSVACFVAGTGSQGFFQIIFGKPRRFVKTESLSKI